MSAVQPLTPEVYGRFVRTLQRRLAAEGLDGLLALDMHNVIYLTGFHHSPSERPIGVFVPASGDPTLFIPLLEKENAERVHLDNIHTYEEFPGVRHPVLWMLDEIGVSRVGIDAVSADLYREALEEYPELRLSRMVEAQRYLKEPEELALVRAAATFADACLEHILEHAGAIIRRGGTELDVLDAGVDAANRLLEETYGVAFAHSKITVVGTVHSGSRAALPHGKTIHKRPLKGETLIAGIGAALGGYHAESGATFTIGEMTDDQWHCLEAAQACNDAALGVLRTGVTGTEVNDAAMQVLRDGGLGDFIRHRIGHGMGVQGHEAPWLAPGGDIPCAPSMVFSNEPGIYRPGLDGYRTINTMIVTGGAAEVPSTFQARHPVAERVILL